MRIQTIARLGIFAWLGVAAAVAQPPASSLQLRGSDQWSASASDGTGTWASSPVQTIEAGSGRDASPFRFRALGPQPPDLSHARIRAALRRPGVPPQRAGMPPVDCAASPRALECR